MIYLIYNAELRHVKIGYSKHPNKRLKQLQTGNSNQLILLHSEPGDLEKEKSIHRALQDYLIGEWYEYERIQPQLPCLLSNWKYPIELSHFLVKNIIFTMLPTLNSVLSVKLMFWMMEIVNTSLILPMNEHQIVKFCEWLYHNSKTSIHSRSVQVALKELVTHNLVLKHGKGWYQLNPVIFKKTS